MEMDKTMSFPNVRSGQFHKSTQKPIHQKINNQSKTLTPIENKFAYLFP